jgi:uncharacterized protein DUF1877
MGTYATYRAVRPEEVAAALAVDEPGPALGQLVFGDDAAGPMADLTNTFDALAYVLAGPGGDREDYANPLVAAVLGHHEVAPDSPAVNDAGWVVEIDRALSEFDRGLIAERYNAADMDAELVEPGGFASDQGWLDTLISSFDQLKGLYGEAARQGLAVLVNIG